MKIIDFDKLYNKYVVKWSKENANKLKKDDPLNYVNEIYEQWLNEPAEEIGGVSVSEYFDKMKEEEAVALLKEYNRQKISVPSPLIDKMSDKRYENALVSLLAEEREEELFILVSNLLEESGSVKHLDILIENMLSLTDNKELRDFCAEQLGVHSNEVKDRLVKRIKGDLGEEDKYIADVLVYCEKDESIYGLLKELFLSGKNPTLYAAYLGMYGDERALPLLKKRIRSEEVGYVEFTELRNAIERMGGEVSVKRDFSHDPDYKILKHIK